MYGFIMTDRFPNRPTAVAPKITQYASDRFPALSHRCYTITPQEIVFAHQPAVYTKDSFASRALFHHAHPNPPLPPLSHRHHSPSSLLPYRRERHIDPNERYSPVTGQHRGELEGFTFGGAVSGVSAVRGDPEERLEGVVDR